MKIYVFGDSIAAAEGYKRSREGWVYRLQDSLNDTKIINKSVNGDTTFETLQRFSVKNPNLIIFAIGINDSKIVPGQGNQVPISEFEENIEKLIKLSGKTKIVFVGFTCADENETITLIEEYRNEEIKKYSDKLKEICKKHKIQFIDIYDKWIKLNYKELLFDGLHPNEKGHKLLFEEISKKI